MHDDGTEKYASYTTRELEEALQSIVPEKYPVNYTNLVSELAIRPDITEQERQTLLFRKAHPQANQEFEKYRQRPATLERLVRPFTASISFLAVATYDLYKNGWFISTGEHRHGREALVFFLFVAVAVCTTAMRLFSWIKHDDQSGPVFRVGTGISYLALYVVICYAMISVLRG